MDIIGRSGKTLLDQWGVDDARAYLGVTVQSFQTSLLSMPLTPTRGTAVARSTPPSSRSATSCRRSGSYWVTETRALEIDRHVLVQYNAELDEALAHCIWSHQGDDNRNDAGRIVAGSPWKYVDYWDRTREFDPGDNHEVDVPSDPRS
jgi:4-hydroxyacetophenone monooxygenase